MVKASSRRFRRGVVDVLTRRAEDGRARGDIHDRSPATPVPVGHPADGLARAQKRPGHVGREYPADACRIHVFDARLPLEDARIVHQPRHDPDRRIDGLEETHDIGLAGDVGLDGDRSAARGAHIGTTASAAASFVRKFTHTSWPRSAAGRAVAAPIPRLAPVMTMTDIAWRF